MKQVIRNIRSLVGTRDTEQPLRGVALATLPAINNAYLLIEDDRIAAFGPMDEFPAEIADLPEQTDASGGFVLPAWCDSHTHLVFPATRENEFIDKIKGLSYAEIAARGGGILNSAARLHDVSEDELYRLAWERLEEVASMGTGAIEIKSGYGLSVDDELKMLRVIRRLKENSPLLIRSTFLGAHAFPLLFRDDQEGYIRLITEEMIPRIAAASLADYIDVFCEEGFFSPSQMETVVEAGIAVGLRPKLHVNQLNSIGGIQMGIRLHALSLDHLETMTAGDIADLADSDTIGTLLPTAAFFLRMPFQPARALIDRQAAVAIASDYNPGSSPSGNMNFVVALSCIQLKMLPEEAINAATINGAFAMGLEQEAGSISIGKKANLIITKPMESLAYFPYSFAHNLIERVMISGRFLDRARD